MRIRTASLERNRSREPSCNSSGQSSERKQKKLHLQNMIMDTMMSKKTLMFSCKLALSRAASLAAVLLSITEAVEDLTGGDFKDGRCSPVDMMNFTGLPALYTAVWI